MNIEKEKTITQKDHHVDALREVLGGNELILKTSRF